MNKCIICGGIDFEFRFLIWRCEFTDRIGCGPLWFVSYPGFRLGTYVAAGRFFKDWRIKREYFSMIEREFYPGRYNLLWIIFNRYQRKYYKSRKYGV